MQHSSMQMEMQYECRGCGLELRPWHLPAVLAKLPALTRLTVDGTLTSLEVPFAAAHGAPQLRLILYRSDS